MKVARFETIVLQGFLSQFSTILEREKGILRGTVESLFHR